jgi:hypothetical protein
VRARSSKRHTLKKTIERDCVERRHRRRFRAFVTFGINGEWLVVSCNGASLGRALPMAPVVLANGGDLTTCKKSRERTRGRRVVSNKIVRTNPRARLITGKIVSTKPSAGLVPRKSRKRTLGPHIETGKAAQTNLRA